MEKKPIPKLPEGILLNNTYTVGKCLGQGGFGITYIGYDVNIQRKVAIKEFFFKRYVYRDQQTLQVLPLDNQKAALVNKEKNRFVDEARILAKLDEQPGIVNVISYFEQFNTAYIIMEYIEGQSLSDYVISRGGWLPVDEVLNIMEPVIKSLALIHQQGIVHRDISPDNIMLTSQGKVKLIDFGAAKTKEMNVNADRVAKRSYSPPEQFNPAATIGTYSDVYAMCSSLYELMGGCKVQNSSDRMGIDTYTSLAARGVAISPVVDAVITNGLELEIDNRIKNATDLYYLLYVYGRDGNGTPEGVRRKIKESSTKVIVEKMQMENKKRKYKVISLVALVIILLLGCGIILVRSINRNTANQSLTTVSDNADDTIHSLGLNENANIRKEQIYDYINQKRKDENVIPAEIYKSYEDVCGVSMRDICDMQHNTTAQWNEAISTTIKDNMSKAKLEGVGWLVLPYTSEVSIEQIYTDAMANIEAINGGAQGGIDLVNCGKMGVAVELHEDGTLFVIIIYK